MYITTLCLLVERNAITQRYDRSLDGAKANALTPYEFNSSFRWNVVISKLLSFPIENIRFSIICVAVRGKLKHVDIRYIHTAFYQYPGGTVHSLASGLFCSFTTWFARHIHTWKDTDTRNRKLLHNIKSVCVFSV